MLERIGKLQLEEEDSPCHSELILSPFLGIGSSCSRKGFLRVRCVQREHWFISPPWKYGSPEHKE
jgi:hypothetical protein